MKSSLLFFCGLLMGSTVQAQDFSASQTIVTKKYVVNQSFNYSPYGLQANQTVIRNGYYYGRPQIYVNQSASIYYPGYYYYPSVSAGQTVIIRR